MKIRARFINTNSALFGKVGTITPTDTDPTFSREAHFLPDGEAESSYVLMMEVKPLPVQERPGKRRNVARWRYSRMLRLLATPQDRMTAIRLERIFQLRALLGMGPRERISPWQCFSEMDN